MDKRLEEFKQKIEADGGKVLYLYLRGSHCQGTNTETSDEDYGGLYITAPDNMLDLHFKYKEQYLDDKNDVCIQEIGKFASLVLKSNPTVLESLFVDDEFVIYEHPVITELKRQRDKFLSKQCFNPFYGYAVSQIGKATGQKKMVTQPIIERKTPLDFCYTTHMQGSTPMKKWLEYRGMNQKYCGLNNIPNMDFMHGVFYAWGNHLRYENISKEEFLSWYRPREYYDVISAFARLSQAMTFDLPKKDVDEARQHVLDAQHQNFIKTILDHYNVTLEDETCIELYLANFYDEQMKKVLPYKGICGDDSEELRLSSVEKGEMPVCTMHYNKDKFSTHCKDWKRQETWKKERNPERFRQNMENLQKQTDAKDKAGFYDSKNLAACYRMIQNSIEIARDGKYIVNRRDIDRDLILKIKKGELTYNEIMDIVNKKKDEMNHWQNISTLRDEVDVEYLNQWLLDVRYKMLRNEL